MELALILEFFFWLFAFFKKKKIRIILISFEITENFIVNHKELEYNSCIVPITRQKWLQKAKKRSRLSRELSQLRRWLTINVIFIFSFTLKPQTWGGKEAKASIDVVIHGLTWTNCGEEAVEERAARSPQVGRESEDSRPFIAGGGSLSQKDAGSRDLQQQQITAPLLHLLPWLHNQEEIHLLHRITMAYRHTGCSLLKLPQPVASGFSPPPKSVSSDGPAGPCDGNSGTDRRSGSGPSLGLRAEVKQRAIQDALKYSSQPNTPW